MVNIAIEPLSNSKPYINLSRNVSSTKFRLANLKEFAYGRSHLQLERFNVLHLYVVNCSS